MTTREKVWYASRPLLVALAGVAAAVLARQSSFWLITTILVLVALIGSSALLGHVGRRRMPKSPEGALPFLELEVIAQVVSVILLFAAVVYFLAWLAEALTKKGDTYLAGVASGAFIAFVTAAFFKPLEEESWVGAHVKKLLVTTYRPFFQKKDQSGQFVGDERAIWLPYGIEADALQKSRFRREDGEWVQGWGWHARRQRVRTLTSGLLRTSDA